MAVSKHFCDDFLISTSVYAEAETCCDDGGCCHNETIFYQVDYDFAVPGLLQLPHITNIDILTFETTQFLTLFPQETFDHIIAERGPPPPPKIQTLLSLKQTWLL